ncbi:hypothetical protein IE53DRAFT_378036 [Violaceomyces palustris]|uniref:Uncharacterized protein n=1 Tax=Violaceomyces palustris TaxID=1673888 RepID=A0ACD0P3C4_9BASI|nr:hypothetical protein IE53DRAFT_378036 [Violaceomyces palustris]
MRMIEQKLKDRMDKKQRIHSSRLRSFREEEESEEGKGEEVLDLHPPKVGISDLGRRRWEEGSEGWQDVEIVRVETDRFLNLGKVGGERVGGEERVECFPDPPSEPPRIKLSKPILIPQRRRGTRSRGFQYLYSPCLRDLGVDEKVWSYFLRQLNRSISFSKSVSLFNTAIDVGGLVAPSWEVALAVLVTQVALTSATNAKSRLKSNAFLQHSNQHLFHPRGLSCAILDLDQIRSLFDRLGSSSPAPPTSSEPATKPNPYLEHDRRVSKPQDLNVRTKIRHKLSLPTWPIDYDPFDFDLDRKRIAIPQHLYSPLVPLKDQGAPCPPRPSDPRLTRWRSILERRAESYENWLDRLPQKRAARSQRKEEDEARDPTPQALTPPHPSTSTSNPPKPSKPPTKLDLPPGLNPITHYKKLGVQVLVITQWIHSPGVDLTQTQAPSS